MLDAWEDGRAPMETFLDGYFVNAVIDACYKSMKTGRWEPVELADVQSGKRSKLMKPAPKPAGKAPSTAPRRSQEAKTALNLGKGRGKAETTGLVAIKAERLPDGRVKRILKDRASGRIVEKIE
jgi:hypothetical protein